MSDSEPEERKIVITVTESKFNYSTEMSLQDTAFWLGMVANHVGLRCLGVDPKKLPVLEENDG